MNLEDSIAAAVAGPLAEALLDRLSARLADPLLTSQEAARLLGISTTSLGRLGLPKVYPTPGSVRYRLSTIRTHIQ